MNSVSNKENVSTLDAEIQLRRVARLRKIWGKMRVDLKLRAPNISSNIMPRRNLLTFD